MTTVDLTPLTGNGEVKNLSGHQKGQAARKHFALDALDHSSEPVSVIIPDFVYAISGSFVQGMFAQSLKELGDLDKFFEHYRFAATPNITRQIERGLLPGRVAAA